MMAVLISDEMKIEWSGVVLSGDSSGRGGLKYVLNSMEKNELCQGVKSGFVVWIVRWSCGGQVKR